MLLFSTILEIDKKMEKEDFINLVIEWNQKGHPESVIAGIEWNGERNIRFEDENKYLEIQEYRNENIIAVRFEKREPDGAVWDTDYIMNFSEMKMSVRLDRSYIEEALNVDTKSFTPFFISMLIDRGYILKDGNLEVQRTPLIIDEDMQKKDSEIERLTSELQKKEYEISWLRSKLNSMTDIPVLVAGVEEDFYPGEVKDFVLSAVKKELSATEIKTRRYDVLLDIINTNNYEAIGEQRAEEAKRLLSNYSGMTPKLKKGLEDIGFIFDQSDHQKVKYYGDGRYTVVYASTPSDKGRGGKNNVRNTVKKAF